MKKILHTTNIYFTFSYFFGDQLKFFVNKGYDIHISCSPFDGDGQRSLNNLKKYSIQQGVKFIEFSFLRKLSLFHDLKTMFGLYLYMKVNKFDIVVGHTPKAALLTMIVSYILKVPNRIFFRHGLIYENRSGIIKSIMVLIEKLTSYLATTVVCVSPYVLEKSIRDNLTLRPKLKLLNIGSCNGVDAINQFNPSNISVKKLSIFQEKYLIDNKDFVIGFVGRLVKDKGVTELVHAFLVLNKRYNNLKLLLIGPYELKDSLEQETLQIIKGTDNIIEVGSISADIEYYYSLMNLFVLPTKREGLGTSLLEASSMNLPVITNGFTGSRDAVIKDFTGLFSEISIEDLVEKIQFYILNKEIAIEHGLNGRDHVLNNFEEKVIWNEIEKLYL